MVLPIIAVNTARVVNCTTRNANPSAKKRNARSDHVGRISMTIIPYVVSCTNSSKTRMSLNVNVRRAISTGTFVKAICATIVRALRYTNPPKSRKNGYDSYWKKPKFPFHNLITKSSVDALQNVPTLLSTTTLISSFWRMTKISTRVTAVNVNNLGWSLFFRIFTGDQFASFVTILMVILTTLASVTKQRMRNERNGL